MATESNRLTLFVPTDHVAQTLTGGRVAKEGTLGLRETLDLPATIMVPASDGTFQVSVYSGVRWSVEFM